MLLPTDQVIGDAGVVQRNTQSIVELRLPWYRSLPLSTVEIAEVTVNGKRLPNAQLSFELEGNHYQIDSLEALTQHVWYVLDSAYLTFDNTQFGSGTHQLSVLMTLYPPYIKGLKRPVINTCEFKISEEVLNG